MRKWPKYEFGWMSDEHDWFAWHPIKTWDGRCVWLKTVGRRRVFKKPFLDGPHWEFWAYSIIRHPVEKE